MVAEQYVHADQVLRSAWENREATGSGIERRLGDLLWSRDVSTRYATVTQLLLKAAYPEVQSTRVSDIQSTPFPSARSLCRNVVVPFNEEIDRPLGDSGDPYVSNPLRVDLLATSSGGDLGQLAEVLGAVERNGLDSEALLRGVMAELELRVPSLRNWLIAGMSAQMRWSTDPTSNGMFRRRVIVDEGIRVAEEAVGEGYVVSGGAGQGTDAEVPWVAVFPSEEASSAQEGVYPVYLFHANGRGVSLSLGIGTEGRSLSQITEAVDELRSDLAGQLEDMEMGIDLKSTQGSSSRPKKYEAGTVAAYTYSQGSLPDEDTLVHHLHRVLDLARSTWDGLSIAEPRRVLCVYIGERSLPNFTATVDDGVWGWRTSHDDYELIEPGDAIVFGIRFLGGSPRVAHQEWLEHSLSDLVVGIVRSEVREEGSPYWPDEQGEVIYPHRLRFELVERLGETPTASIDGRFGEGVSDAIRRSATSGGRGVLVQVEGGEPMTSIPDTSGVSLSDVCDAFSSATRLSHLDYGTRHDELIRSFVTSLATKGFVLLTGLSGSGKTRIAMAFGQWLGEGHLKVVPVRPDWTGPDALLGYENQLSTRDETGYAWVAPDTLRFVLQAARDPEQPYLLLLDEMNLAHVERYFADVLSGIESGKAVLPNLSESNGEWRRRPGEDSYIPFPRNLSVVGTVNIDETTYMFSPKVLDRANTLEFRVLSSELKAHDSPPTDVASGDRVLVRRFLEDSVNSDVAGEWPDRSSMAAALVELHELLAAIDREFGHRVFAEALRFGALHERAGVDDWMQALDLQVMQKVLPRFHGSVKQIADPLNLLGSWCYFGPESGQESTSFDPEDFEVTEAALPISFDKVRRMKRRVLANHFVSFAE